MEELPARGKLFGKGLPPAGEACEASFNAGYLMVSGRPAIPVSAVALDSSGFNHDVLKLDWSEEGVALAFLCDGPDDSQRLLKTAPESLTSSARGFRWQVSRTRWIWRFIATLAAAIVLAIGVFWWQYDAAVAWAARQISPETELHIGRSGLAQLKAEWEMLPDTPYQEVVEDLGGRLTVGSRYDYQWYIADTDDINAMALPGGIVIVFRGLIDRAETPEELAGVLAHEVQHVELQHTLQGMIHSLGWATVLTIFLGDASALTAILAFQVGNSYFSRELEAEADLGGVTALHKAQIDPNGMVHFFETMIEEVGDQSITLLSSHPASSERIEELESMIATLPQTDYPGLDVDWEEIVELRVEEADAE